jgi:hypothetical protein
VRLRKRRRHAIVHLRDNLPSVEGIVEGPYGGHYLVSAPKVDDGTENTYSLAGHLEIPAQNVVYIQVVN